MSDSTPKKPSSLLKEHKRKVKVYNPLVWILDPDPKKAPHLLTNKYLNKSIENGVQILLCARFWLAGIRNKKAFAYWFSEERAEATMKHLFNNYTFEPGTVLKFSWFKHRTTKWARKCSEHMKFLEDFVWSGICEWQERTGSSHPCQDFAEYLCVIDPASDRIPKANLKRLVLEWKNIPPQYRQNDIYKAFRVFYAYCIGDPWTAYAKDKVDIPEFLIEKM